MTTTKKLATAGLLGTAFALGTVPTIQVSDIQDFTSVREDVSPVLHKLTTIEVAGKQFRVGFLGVGEAAAQECPPGQGGDRGGCNSPTRPRRGHPIIINGGGAKAKSAATATIGDTRNVFLPAAASAIPAPLSTAVSASGCTVVEGNTVAVGLYVVSFSVGNQKGRFLVECKNREDLTVLVNSPDCNLRTVGLEALSDANPYIRSAMARLNNQRVLPKSLCGGVSYDISPVK